ncbi:MAG TPA: hypothetical protein VMM38_01275 [Aridibacter sp.]|nr:hypothetical protein [Aridibacter sp.]
MADQPVENLFHDFLVGNSAQFGANVEIHPSAYETRSLDNGIVIGDADTSMSPDGNQDSMTEYDGLLAIEIYGRVRGSDKSLRSEARRKVFEIKTALLQLLEKYPTLDGRVCRVRVLRQVRFFDDTKADKYAIERVPVVINPFDYQGE